MTECMCVCVCAGLMGQAAIQAGVPVDVRQETPTHLSFQASLLDCVFFSRSTSAVRDVYVQSSCRHLPAFFEMSVA